MALISGVGYARDIPRVRITNANGHFSYLAIITRHSLRWMTPSTESKAMYVNSRLPADILC